MSDPISSAVSLPAGSYDYDDLRKGLDKAAKGTAKSYEDNVDAALDTAREGERFEGTSLLPGYKLMERPIDGTDQVEIIQVYDPKQADEAEAAQSSNSQVVQPTPAGDGE